MGHPPNTTSPARSFKPVPPVSPLQLGKPVLQAKCPAAPPVHVPPAVKQFKPVSLVKKSAPVGPAPIQRQTTHATARFPVDLKRGMSPPVYRPQFPTGASLQPRSHHPGVFRTGSAPPVYRPLPSPTAQPVARPQKQIIPGTRLAAGVPPNPIMPAAFAARNTIQNSNRIAQPPKPANRYSGASRTVLAHSSRHVVQPACSSLTSCWNAFVSLFCCCLPSQPQYSALPDPSFSLTYGSQEIRQRIAVKQSQASETNWFTDDTCSSTAKRVTQAFATGKAIESGKTQDSLAKFMRGEGRTAPDGVIIHVKLRWQTPSEGSTSTMFDGTTQHEFAILQKGSECFLLQAWLGKLDLNQWLSSTEGQRKRSISEILGSLKNLETALKTKNPSSINTELQNTFTVQESHIQTWTSLPMEMTWEAWNQQGPS